MLLVVALVSNKKFKKRFINFFIVEFRDLKHKKGFGFIIFVID